jgi:lipopolysaccharide/colanic/teichoic acid biosynthesis glycosyltransferase/nucleoside-diphosphate-sugar epimerase
MTMMFYRHAGKRYLDAMCAFIGLIVLSPLFAVVAIAVKLTSPGPAFFRQDRVGLNGNLFKIFKFRTMITAKAPAANSLVTASGDPRITKLGAWLRVTKIDELPQLINVLLGHMSLVGPRPEVSKYVNIYTDRQKHILRARPGMTGASINIYEEELLAAQADKEGFYINTILPAKLEVALQYCENISFWNDLKLIAGTFPMIFGRLKLLPNSPDQEPAPSMKNKYDLYSRLNQMIVDGVSFATSLILAYFLSFNRWPVGSDLPKILVWVPVLVSLRLFVHWRSGIYRQIWRFVSFADALETGKSILIVSLGLAILRLVWPANAVWSGWIRVPMAVIALEGLASLTLTMSARALRRILYRQQRKETLAAGYSAKRVVLYGAGRAGITLRRELEASPFYDLVGFIDDDPDKVGAMVEKTLVLGIGNDLQRLAARYGIEEVLICMATAGKETLERVLDNCKNAKVPSRVIPSTRELLANPTIIVRPLSVGNGNGNIPASFGGDLQTKKGVLVIGGAGYIGSTLVRQLLAKQYRVRVLDSLMYGNGGIRELLSHPDFELIQGDSRDVESVVRSYRDIGAVIHLGAIVGDAACALEPSRTVEINLAATKMISDICKGYGISRFLFASTCSVYGASDELVDEQSQPNPISLYASTKLDSEGIILDSATPEFHPTILRLATAFGASYRLRFDLVVNVLAIKALTEKKITLHGGSQWRPFIHVHDISRAFILAMESEPEKVSKQIFNAGSDDLTFTIAQLGDIICEHVPGVKIEIAPEGDKRNYRVSFEKIRERLGFECEKNIEYAVLEFKKLYEAERIGDYRDRQYSNHEFLKTQPAQDTALTGLVNLPLAATLKSLNELSALSKL